MSNFIKPNSTEAYIFFWAMTLAVLIIPLILALTNWDNSLPGLGIRGFVLFLIWVFYVIYIFIYGSFQNTESGFKHADMDEVALAKCWGLELFGFEGPLLLIPGIFQIRKEKSVIQEFRDNLHTETQMELPTSEGILNGLMLLELSIWRRVRVKGSRGYAVAIRKAGDLINAYIQHKGISETALHYQISSRTPNQVLSDRHIIDDALLKDVKRLNGEDDNQSERFLGIETLDLRISGRILPLEITLKTQKLAETEVEKKIELVKADQDKLALIKRKEGEAEGIKLTGLAGVDVERASLTAKAFVKAIGREELLKRLGLKGDKNAATLIEALEQSPEIFGDKVKMLMLGGGGAQGSLFNEIFRLLAGLNEMKKGEENKNPLP